MQPRHSQSQDALIVQSILRKYAGNIVPFRPKAGNPTVKIRGVKYALSTYGGPLHMEDDAETGAWGGRLIKGPSTTKWKYLWAYDTDKQILAMWRVSDGNEKVWDSARSQMTRIVTLDKKGQLNRLSHSQFQDLDRAMRAKEDEHIQALERIIEETKTKFQREVDTLVERYFEIKVEPELHRRLSEVEQGVVPFGFKSNPRLPYPPQEQMRSWIKETVVRQMLALDVVEDWLRAQGVDIDNPEVDNQATYWAIGDVTQRVWSL